MHELTRAAIERMARFRPDPFTLLMAALAVLGAALILAREVTYGVGLYSDYASYLTVAESLLAGEGFVQIHGWPYLHWPPLYPLLLAGASLYLFDPIDVAGPLNAAVFGLTLFVAGRYLRQSIQHRFLVIWACLAMMLAIPLTQVASVAISEAPFILFVTLSLAQTSRYLHSGKRAHLIGAAVFASLAFLTRYIGVTLIITTLPLLLFPRGIAPLEKAKRIGLYLLISAAPLGLWLLRNVLVHGRLQGRRNPLPWTLLEILDKFLSDLARWVFLYLPSGEVRVAAAALTGIVLLALAISVGYTFVRSRQQDGGWHGWSPFYLCGGFALVYLIFLTAAQTATAITPLGDRHLSPVYIPLLLAAVFALDKFWSYEQGRKLMGTVGSLPIIRTYVQGKGIEQRSLLTVALSLVFSLWLAAGAALNAREIRQNNAGMGMGLTGPAWVDSEVLQYIREHLLAKRIFSNATRAIYIYTDHADYHFLSRDLNVAKQQIKHIANGAYIVWIDTHYDYNYNLAKLRELSGLKLVVDLDDGIIFKVSAVAGEPAVRSTFDVYLGENTLTYVKEPCILADTQERFFLHLIPVNEDDLPAGRQQYGFDNLNFGGRGAPFEGKCVRIVPLPDYAIARIRTGQYIPGEGPVWNAEFRFEP